MESSKSSNLRFKFLWDGPAKQDRTGAQSHARIADRIADLVLETYDHDINIALEGDWGAGKSTVVEILRQKFEKATGVFCFYFDAWAHEGDLLRRTLIQKLNNEVRAHCLHGDLEAVKTLNKIEYCIGRDNVVRTTAKSSFVTGQGLIFGILAILSVLGVNLVRQFIGEVCISLDWVKTWWRGPESTLFGLIVAFWHSVHKPFSFGLLLMLSPVVSLYISWKNGKKALVSVLKKKDADENGQEEGLLTGVERVECNVETSNGGEQTSISFEKSFWEILKVLHEKKYSRFVFVCDNLDRVDKLSALRIWSLLQIFIQRKSVDATSLGNDFRLFSIVPYDVNGLGNVICPTLEDVQSEAERNHATPSVKRTESFFEKTFNIRVHVPKLSSAEWRQSAKRLINKCLTSVSEHDRDIVMNILASAREDQVSVPTIRKLKSYVNHLGLLAPLHASNNVKLASVAYYVVKRYIDGMSDDEIEQNIVEGCLPGNESLVIGDPDELKRDLCSILFCVPISSALPMLLENPINIAIVENDSGRLSDLFKIHGDPVFDIAIRCICKGVVAKNGGICSTIDCCHKSFSDTRSTLAIQSYIAVNKEEVATGMCRASIAEMDSVLSYCRSNEQYYDLLDLYKERLTDAFVKSQSSKTVSAARVKEVNDAEFAKKKSFLLDSSRLGLVGLKAYFKSEGGAADYAQRYLSPFDGKDLIAELNFVTSIGKPQEITEEFIRAAKFIALHSRSAVEWDAWVIGLERFFDANDYSIAVALMEVINILVLREDVIGIISKYLLKQSVITYISSNSKMDVAFKLSAHILRFVGRKCREVKHSVRDRLGRITHVYGASVVKYWETPGKEFLRYVWGNAVASQNFLWLWDRLVSGDLKDSNRAIFKWAIAEGNTDFLFARHPYDNYVYAANELTEDEKNAFFTLCGDGSVIGRDASRKDKDSGVLDKLDAVLDVLRRLNDDTYIRVIEKELSSFNMDAYVSVLKRDSRKVSSVLKLLYQHRDCTAITCLGRDFVVALITVLDKAIIDKDNKFSDFQEDLLIYRSTLMRPICHEFDSKLVAACFSVQFDVDERMMPCIVETFKDCALDDKTVKEFAQLIRDNITNGERIDKIKRIVEGCGDRIHLPQDVLEILENHIKCYDKQNAAASPANGL